MSTTINWWMEIEHLFLNEIPPTELSLLKEILAVEVH